MALRGFWPYWLVRSLGAVPNDMDLVRMGLHGAAWGRMGLYSIGTLYLARSAQQTPSGGHFPPVSPRRNASSC
jgi:hypothetical protein